MIGFNYGIYAKTKMKVKIQEKQSAIADKELNVDKWGDSKKTIKHDGYSLLI